MTFDPQRVAAAATSGGLHLALGPAEEASYRRHGAAGNAAAAALGTILSAWLVGEGARLGAGLVTATAWLEQAERGNEAFGPPAERWFHRARRRRALALARWLAGGGAGQALWAAASLIPPRARRGAEDEVRSMRDALLGRLPHAPRAACALGGDAARTVLAAMGREIVAGRSVCVAAHAAMRPLGDVLGPLLDGGGFIEAAAWLKLLFWTSGLRGDAAASLLAVYDVLPGLTVPPAVALARAAPAGAAARLRAALVERFGESIAPAALATLGLRAAAADGRLMIALPRAPAPAGWPEELSGPALRRHLGDALRGLVAGDAALLPIEVVAPDG